MRTKKVESLVARISSIGNLVLPISSPSLRVACRTLLTQLYTNMKTLASISSLVGVTLIFAGVFTYDPLTALGAVISATSGLFIFEK